jgi:hypothetical protein
LGGGLEDYYEVEYFTKAKMKRLLMLFTQKHTTKPSNTHPAFHSMPTRPREIFIKGDA